MMLELTKEEREAWSTRRDVARRDCFSVSCPECDRARRLSPIWVCRDCDAEARAWVQMHRPDVPVYELRDLGPYGRVS